MKTVKRTARLLVAAIMINASLFLATYAADPDTTLNVRQVKSEERKAFIRITNLSEDKPAVLKIKDKQGHVLHREVIRQREAYARKYNFSQLPAGEYIVELSTSDGVMTELFNLHDGKAVARYFKPAIQVEPNLVKVAFMNRIDSPVSLKLYDQRGEVLYEETVPSQEKFIKGLDVSKLSAGQYSLTILGDDYVYSKSIQLE